MRNFPGAIVNSSNIISLFLLHVYHHLLRLAGGASGVAGLAVEEGVWRVRLRFGELSGVIIMEPAE